jgi:hypothetical protein
MPKRTDQIKILLGESWTAGGRWKITRDTVVEHSSPLEDCHTIFAKDRRILFAKSQSGYNELIQGSLFSDVFGHQ